MKVKVLKSFAGFYGDKRQPITATEGEIIDLPPDVDWIGAGFVEPIPEDKPARKTKAVKDEDQD
jgi:hypothetical protein